MEATRRCMLYPNGLLPLGNKALVKGEIDETQDFMVKLGAGVYVQMSRKETLTHIASKIGIHHGPEPPIGATTSVSEAPTFRQRKDTLTIQNLEIQTKEMEIVEELTEEDLSVMQARSRPRVAHKPQVSSTRKEIGMQSSKPTLVQKMQNLKVGPLKSRVIERVAPEGMKLEEKDPSHTLIRTNLQESLFRRRTALKDSFKCKLEETRLVSSEESQSQD